jgi:hypothetical protein
MVARPLPLRRLFVSSDRLKDLLGRIRQNEAMTARVRALLPVDLAAHLVAALLQDGRLLLLASSPAWASRLRFSVPQLRHGLAKIRDIRVAVLPETHAKPRRPQVKAWRTPTFSAEVAEQIRAVAATLTDPQLKSAMLRLAAHSEGQRDLRSYQEAGTGRI